MQILSFTALASLAIILLIWFGYPLAIWLIAKVVGQPIVPDSSFGESRYVSVVIASRDGADAVAARVENVLDTAHPPELLEVIVAQDLASSKATPVFLGSQDQRVRIVIGDAPGGKASTLNAGVRAATGEILVMADVAQRFDSETIPQLVAALADERFGAVSGALNLGRDGRASPVNLYWQMEKWLRSNESLIHSSVGVTGAVYATRRALWLDLPAGTLLDDVYVPMSLVLRGHRVGFTYAAKARDVRTFESKTEGARKTRTLTGVIQLLGLLPEIKTSSNPVRLQFTMHKLARLSTPLWVALLVLAAMCNLALLALRSPLPALLFSLSAIMTFVVIPPLRRTGVYFARWFYSIQLAMLRAIGNGARGNWSVWKEDSKER